ncbi:hypothetical protein M885DRAFT_520248 [Pelagophyceae sp. CCMP2097]|nr:hypothetical protein M885DRAFT_520248 [Pelagophyceae sp. CCMP2097]
MLDAEPSVLTARSSTGSPRTVRSHGGSPRTSLQRMLRDLDGASLPPLGPAGDALLDFTRGASPGSPRACPRGALDGGAELLLVRIVTSLRVVLGRADAADAADSLADAASLEPASLEPASLEPVSLEASVLTADGGARPGDAVFANRLLVALEKFVSHVTRGRSYAAQFQESGGVPLLLSAVWRPAALRVLVSLAGLGRDFKEAICSHEGVSAVVGAVLATDAPADSATSSLADDGAGADVAAVRDLATALLVQLAFGNPEHGASVRHGLLCLLAARSVAVRLVALRAMSAVVSRDSATFVPRHAETYPTDFLPAILGLLHVGDANHEATALLKDLLTSQPARPVVVGGLVRILNKRNPNGSLTVGFLDDAHGLRRVSPLAAAKLSACDILTHLVAGGADAPAGADADAAAAAIGLCVEKNVVRVLWRVLTDRKFVEAAAAPKAPLVLPAAAPVRPRDGDDDDDEPATADLVLRCIRLVSLLYDRDVRGGTAQRFVRRLLAAGDDCKLVPRLACSPDAFYRDYAAEPRALAKKMRAALRRVEAECGAEAAAAAAADARAPTAGLTAGETFFLTDLDAYEDEGANAAPPARPPRSPPRPEGPQRRRRKPEIISRARFVRNKSVPQRGGVPRGHALAHLRDRVGVTPRNRRGRRGCFTSTNCRNAAAHPTRRGKSAFHSNSSIRRLFALDSKSPIRRPKLWTCLATRAS